DIDALTIDFQLECVDGIVVFQHFAGSVNVAICQRTQSASQSELSFSTQTKHSVTQHLEFLFQMCVNLRRHSNLDVLIPLVSAWNCGKTAAENRSGRD